MTRRLQELLVMGGRWSNEQHENIPQDRLYIVGGQSLPSPPVLTSTTVLSTKGEFIKLIIFKNSQSLLLYLSVRKREAIEPLSLPTPIVIRFQLKKFLLSIRKCLNNESRRKILLSKSKYCGNYIE